MSRVKNFLKSITLEPAIVSFILGLALILGAQIQTDLLIWKICHIELNNTEDACANLRQDF